MKQSPGRTVLLALLVAAAAAGQSVAAQEARVNAPAVAAGSRETGVVAVPERGQSANQLWADRYACDEWAKDQSGYDSSHPTGGEEIAQRLSYRRALVACLKARGYAVQNAAAPAPPLPPAQAPVYRTQYWRSDLRPSGWDAYFPYRPFRVQIEGGPAIPEGMLRHDLDNGYDIGAGFTWQPTHYLPLALRVDGMYAHFDDRDSLLEQAAGRLGTAVDFGETEMWGGDVDLELDALLSPHLRMYLLGGVGGYDRRDTFYQVSELQGVFCGAFACFEGELPVTARVGTDTTGMRFEKNAGVGLEFALSPGASFFMEARYMRFDFHGQASDFVPVRFGLRF